MFLWCTSRNEIRENYEDGSRRWNKKSSQAQKKKFCRKFITHTIAEAIEPEFAVVVAFTHIHKTSSKVHSKWRKCAIIFLSCPRNAFVDVKLPFNAYYLCPLKSCWCQHN